MFACIWTCMRFFSRICVLESCGGHFGQNIQRQKNEHYAEIQQCPYGKIAVTLGDAFRSIEQWPLKRRGQIHPKFDLGEGGREHSPAPHPHRPPKWQFWFLAKRTCHFTYRNFRVKWDDAGSSTLQKGSSFPSGKWSGSLECVLEICFAKKICSQIFFFRTQPVLKCNLRNIAFYFVHPIFLADVLGSCTKKVETTFCIV